jgi:hypothetical protein
MNGWLQRQAASCKLQAASDKRQAKTGWKLEAGSQEFVFAVEERARPYACCAADSDLQLGQHPMAAWLPHQTQAFGFWLLAFGLKLEACGLRLAACGLLLAACCFQVKKTRP